MSRTPWIGFLFVLALSACQKEAGDTARREPSPNVPRNAPVAAATPAAAAETAFDARPFFENTVLVTDKGDYVHMFWNAFGAASVLEGPDRRRRLAIGAAQLVLDRLPADVAKEIAKVDIVFVKERNEYGQPKWDSLQKIAHFELHVARIKEAAQITDGRVTAIPEQAFDRIDVVG